VGPVANMVGEGGVGIASTWDMVAEEGAGTASTWDMVAEEGAGIASAEDTIAEEGVGTASTEDTVAEVVDRVGWVERLGGATEIPSSSRTLRTLQYSVRKELNKEFEHTQSALNLRHQTRAP
jgi:hypothetical protein